MKVTKMRILVSIKYLIIMRFPLKTLDKHGIHIRWHIINNVFQIQNIENFQSYIWENAASHCLRKDNESCSDHSLIIYIYIYIIKCIKERKLFGWQMNTMSMVIVSAKFFFNVKLINLYEQSWNQN